MVHFSSTALTTYLHNDKRYPKYALYVQSTFYSFVPLIFIPQAEIIVVSNILASDWIWLAGQVAESWRVSGHKHNWKWI